MHRPAVAVTGRAPRSDPLTYPGTPPPGDGVLDGWSWHAADPASLDDVLAGLSSPRLVSRVPVLAVGSNADRAQLATKLEAADADGVVALAPVDVPGLRVGVVPMVSSWGYLPAAPVADPDAGARLTVGWWTPDQLAAIDATELGPYRRAPLPSGSAPLLASSGMPVRGCDAFVSNRGVLADRSGRPLDLASQADLIAWLLDELPALAASSGGTAASFAERARQDAAFRREVGRRVREAGLVTHPPWPA